MQIVITSQPEPLVTFAEACVALGESGTDRQGFIEGLILAAQAELDGPKGWVGIAVAAQSVAVTFATFDDPPIRLPGGTIDAESVVVTYLDGDGTEQTLAAASYVVTGGGISLAVGGEWPTLADQIDAVTVSYDVGIVDETDPRVSLMKTAILLHVRMTMDGVDPAASRRAIEALVRPMWVPVA